MHIAVFGTGYVGLVTALCFAEVGNHVYAVDTDIRKISQLKSGISPIYEAGISDLLHKNLQSGNIVFTSEADQAVASANIIFIAVGTPPKPDGSANTAHVLAVSRTIGELLNDYKVIVNKSTVPVGTADLVSDSIQSVLKQRNKQVLFDVVSNPEFLKEGAAIEDCMFPDRIILGSNSERAVKLLSELYVPFNRDGNKLLIMDAKSAEFTKYVANAMLATKISFMNEMSQIAERVGANIESVKYGIGLDPRIGKAFINPGCGYGGSCFPKDVSALVHMAKQAYYEPKILTAVEQVNYNQKLVLFNKVKQVYAADSLAGKVFAIWGLAFKPNTDDIRDAPSLVMVEQLLKAGAIVQAYDPKAMANFSQTIWGNHPNFKLCDSMYSALKESHALVVLTEWAAFSCPDFVQISALLRDKLIFDGRNIYNIEYMQNYSLTYISIGRAEVGAAISVTKESKSKTTASLLK